MRLLCDEMLKRLGQWLRTAGHDVLILPDGSDDSSLLQRAAAEQRIVLTRDREMARTCIPDAQVILLECNDLETCVADLQRKLPIDWLYRPFTRCMACNSPLCDVPDERLHEVPADLPSPETSRYCPQCNQVFWDGSHVARMRERLSHWQRMREASDGE